MQVLCWTISSFSNYTFIYKLQKKTSYQNPYYNQFSTAIAFGTTIKSYPYIYTLHDEKAKFSLNFPKPIEIFDKLHFKIHIYFMHTIYKMNIDQHFCGLDIYMSVRSILSFLS